MRILYLFACLWRISLLGFLGGNYSISKMKKNRMHFCIDWCIDWLHEERVGRLFEAKIPALITHFSKVRLKIDANSPTLSNTFFIILVISFALLTIIKPLYCIRVDSVAHGLVYVVRCAQNGSIWISEDGKPVYEIQLFDSLPQKHNESILEENERKMQID